MERGVEAGRPVDRSFDATPRQKTPRSLGGDRRWSLRDTIDPSVAEDELGANNSAARPSVMDHDRPAMSVAACASSAGRKVVVEALRRGDETRGT